MNYFDIKAKKKLSEKIRKWKKTHGKTGYQTGSGCNNRIIKITATHIYILTKRGKKPFAIRIKAILKAMAFILFRRTTTRKELEHFTAYNSAMMGLLRLIYIEVARFSRTVKGMLRLSLKGIRHYFGGVEASPGDMERICQQEGKYVLLNYYHLRRYSSNKWFENLIKYDLFCLIDSGAYTLHEKKRKNYPEDSQQTIFSLINSHECEDSDNEITVEEYASFINHYKKSGRVLGFFSLDVINNKELSRKNYEALVQLTGIQPIAVWHPASGFEELDRMLLEEHEIVALGGMVTSDSPWRLIKEQRKLFNKLFSQYGHVNWHWLGGGNELLLEYPFFSSDSTKYLYPRKCGEDIMFSLNGFRKIPSDWSVSDALDFGINQYVQLEEFYDLKEKAQLDFSWFSPEFLRKQVRTEQLCFF